MSDNNLSQLDKIVEVLTSNSQYPEILSTSSPR